MSDTINDTLPVVNVVKKKWVNFGNEGEEIVDKIDTNDTDQKYETNQHESSNINLPPPPRPKSRQKHNSSDSKHSSSDHKHTDHHNDKSSRSSTPYLSSSPSSSNQTSNRANNEPTVDRQSRPGKLDIVDKSSDIHQANDCTLNMPETFITTSPLNNLQNVPLRDTSTPTNSNPPPIVNNNTTNNTPRFSEFLSI